jgi:PKD domain-containing protein
MKAERWMPRGRVVALVACLFAGLAVAAVAPRAFAVAVRAERPASSAATQSLSARSTTGNVSWHAGPIVHSSRPFLVFWTPSGESIPASSQSLLARFFTDAAANSGKASNVFGVDRQYYDSTGFADYRQTFNPARQVIVDTQPYPPQDPAKCPNVSSAYPTCISDGQVQSELQRLITSEGLPTAGSGPELSAKAPIYFVILPADVNVCSGSGLQSIQCAGNGPCGYHGSFVDKRRDRVLYAPLPLQPLRDGSVLYPDPKGVCQLDNTSVVQDPNSDVNTDLMINIASHEYSETITDPIVDAGWFDTSTYQEVGDNCELAAPFNPAKGHNPNAFTPTLGGSEAAGTLFTQLLNGHPYYLQSVWSNGDGNCEMRPTVGRIVPRFTVPQEPNTAGATLSFNPRASTSSNPLSSATWNFGDGSKPAFFYPSAIFLGSSTLTRAKHRYRRAGRYTITLTLVDNRGNLQSTTRRLTIHAHRKY